MFSFTRSITLRLSILFGMLSITVLAVVGWHLYRFSQIQTQNMDERELLGKVELVRHLLHEFPDAAALVKDTRRLRDVLVGDTRVHFVIWNEAGVPLFQSSTLPIPSAKPQSIVSVNDIPSATVMASWKAADGAPFRVVAAQAAFGYSSVPPAVVAVALDVGEHSAMLSHYLENLLLTLCAGGILAASIGYWVAQVGLRPLQSIAVAAGGITAMRLDVQLDTRDVPTELESVVKAFNTMVRRLEQSFQRLLDYSADLAHELRTPINALIVQMQVTLSKERSNEDLRTTMEANVEQCERLSRIVADMLFLAQADNEQIVVDAETFDLRESVDKLLEFFEPVAAQKGLRLVSEGRATVMGDRRLLERVVENLVSNALRYSSRQSQVAVNLRNTPDGTVVLIVTNYGTLIPAEHHTRIFNRFYRVQRSTTDEIGNVGLGLAIVKSIVELHGGTVNVKSSESGGTSFTVRFPSSQSFAP